MAIIILTISAYLILAVYLPTSAFSQMPFVPDSHNSSATNSNHTTIHSDNYSNKTKSSEGHNSSSINKLTNTSKSKLSIRPVNATQATTILSQKGVDKFGIKEIYPTKKDI